MNEINKTIVTCTAILAVTITIGITIISTFGIYIYFYASRTESRDRLTICIDTAMTKSIEAGKPISAKEAKEVCG